MKCNNHKIKEHLTAFIDNALSLEEYQTVEKHLNNCSDCLKELQEIRSFNNYLAEVPQLDPPAGMEKKFLKMLNTEQSGKDRSISITFNFSWRKLAAAIIIFVAGTATGLLLPDRGISNNASIAGLESQISQMRQILMTVLINNESPSDRLKAVHYAEQIPQPSAQVTDILIGTLNDDPSVNVRLAAANALQQFAAHNEVRTALAESLQKQSDPLLQIVLIKMLVQMHEQAAVPTLQQFSTDRETHEMVKKEADEALTILL